MKERMKMEISLRIEMIEIMIEEMINLQSIIVKTEEIDDDYQQYRLSTIQSHIDFLQKKIDKANSDD
jgi:hypothetical protein